MKSDLHGFYRQYWTPEVWKEYIQASSPAILYHNSRETSFVREIFRPTDGELICDAGCGYGRVSKVMLESTLTAKIIGIDISPSMISYASDWLKDRFEGIVTDLELLPFSSELFDAIFCSGVIMYVQDEGAVIQELSRVLRPQGRIMLSVHNLLSPFSLPIIFNNRILKRGKLKQSRRTPWYYFRLLSKAGIKVTRVIADTIFSADMTLPYFRRRGSTYLPPQRAMPVLKLLDHLASRTFLTYFGHELYLFGIKESYAT
jgi:ubiquinone/menaquinone biosynthesis C-methylase UbiE